MTSKRSPLKGDQLTLFVVDFPAKTSAPQGNKPVSRKAQGLVSFTNSCESFAWFDQNTLCWKTSQRSLLTDWTPFLGNWPRQGLMRNGHVFQQVLWEPAINVIAGGSLLGTPRACLAKNSRIDSPCNLQYAANPAHPYPNLEIQLARMLPTPCSLDSTHNHMTGSVLKHRDLAGQLAQNHSIQTGEGIYLNPYFVEEMMGFPVGWTDSRL